MNEELTPRMQQRAQILYRYISALESGDVEAVIAALQEAEQDQVLERIILKVNEVYQDEDSTVSSLDEFAQIQTLLLSALSLAELYQPEQSNGVLPTSTNSLLLLERQSRQTQERRQPIMKIQSQSTDLPEDGVTPQLPNHTPRPTRLRRWSARIQTLVAVFVVAALVTGFLLLFSSHQRGQGAPGPSPTSSSSFKGTWHLVKSPNPGSTQNNLNGVAAISANDVWAVGDTTSLTTTGQVQQALIIHWNGTQWSVVPVPSGTTSLTAVTAVSANDVWAVGYGSGPSPNYATQALIVHWNGTQWREVESPNLPDSALVQLEGVTVISANDIWAVGLSSFGGPRTIIGQQALIEHWNGTQWSIVPNPNQNGLLNGVAAVSASDVWAVGDQGGLIEHWNGTQWSIVPSPDSGVGLLGVTAISANDVWAVGDMEQQELIEHWNGTQWSIVPNPNPPLTLSFLSQVTAVSANDIWAVGRFSNDGQALQPLTAHWNGREWSVVSSPNLNSPQNLFSGMAKVPSSNTLWAVGASYLTKVDSRSLIEMYS